MSWWETNKKTVYAVGAVAAVVSVAAVLMRAPKRKTSRGSSSDYARWRDRRNTRIQREAVAGHARRAKGSFQMARKAAGG